MMRILPVSFVLCILLGTAFSPCGCAGPSKGDTANLMVIDVGESITAGGTVSGQQSQNRTQDQTATQEPNVTSTGDEMPAQGHPIEIQPALQRRTGTISVPQGILARILAREHIMSMGGESFQFNESLQLQFRAGGENRSFKFRPIAGALELTDRDVSVVTDEEIELDNDSVYVGRKKLIFMPSAVPGKIGAKTIKSILLHIADDELRYDLNATKRAQLFWLFDVEMDVEVTVDGTTGEIKNEKRPWWSFLASSD